MTRGELLQIAKPILFNTDMVRAIQDNRKTATRRVIKCPEHKVYDAACTHGKWYETYNPADMPEHLLDWYAKEIAVSLYKRGDILYVRETWGFQKCSNCENCTNCTNIGFEHIYKDDGGCFVYRTNYGTTEDDSFPPSLHKWHPSIHMPKEAARIFLRVTEVRAERLQDMPHDGPMKEGIHFCICPDGFTWQQQTDMHNCYITPMGAMAALWDSTIPKKDLNKYGWDVNPWARVIEFERVEMD